MNLKHFIYLWSQINEKNMIKESDNYASSNVRTSDE